MSQPKRKLACRYGVAIPLAGVPLHEHRSIIEEIASLGYDDVWTGEGNEHDAFTPLALAAGWVPTLRLATGIVPVFTRGPAVLAQTVASMCDIAPGRFVFGVGTSSEVIVQKWNAVRFNRPVHRVRDTLRFLRLALAGEKVTEKFDTFEVNGFRLGTGPVSEMPKMLVAALRPAMLKLAAAESDGAIVNWMAPEDLEIVRGELSSDKELVVRAKVIVSDDWSVVRAIAVRSINAYFHVDAYRKSQEWLGRGEVLAPMWNAWQSGDRRMASELIPDDVIDALFVWGGHERIRSGLENYATQGATTVVPVFYTPDSDLRVDLRALAPSRVGPQL